MTLEPAIKERLDSLVQGNKVVLFMKGNRKMPQCGFSSRVVGILDGLLEEYATVDVLKDPAVRSGIKDYSDWPTLPQLYIDGEFRGGCDIVTEMAASGELHQALGIVLEEVEPPELTITDSAVQALTAALQDTAEGDFLRFAIPPSWRYELNLGPRVFGDVEVVVGGLTLVMDRSSAQRAGGTVIDFVQGPMGEGFSISNPSEPKPVQPMSAPELKALMDSGASFEFFDVRNPQERAIASIEGARLLDRAAQDYIISLDRSTTLVFHCHHGMRSQQAADHFRGLGFQDVHNLTGGIQAWSEQVDSSVPTY